MYGVWIPFQEDQNCDEVAQGWLHDCGSVLRFPSAYEAEVYAQGWLSPGIAFEARPYDEQEASLSDA